MILLLVLLCIICCTLLLSRIQLQIQLYSLCDQLEEIRRGSHMELTSDCRQKPLLMLCRLLNEILASRDRAYIQYDQAEKLLKQNITGLAHDIRTPLTGASGYVQFALECEDGEKRIHYLETAKRRLTELEDMLEKMFLYTKLTGEDFSLTLKKIQVRPVLDECLLSLYTQFEEKNVSPLTDFESEDFQINGDEDALKRIFLNLIQNALFHGTGGISVTQRGRNVIFENPLAKDNRPDTELMFDRFYKADTARRKGSSGLGLFIVRELMERMDGTVSAGIQGDILSITMTFPGPDSER